MSLAVLIPLYKPNGNHVLLFKSLFSRIEPYTTIIILVDGSETIDELGDEFHSLMNLAITKYQSDLIIREFRENLGYPQCYIELCKIALEYCECDVFHFLDQDDYCLPNRFLPASNAAVCTSQFITITDGFESINLSSIKNLNLSPLLQTTEPGMTFSVRRGIIHEYLQFIENNETYSNVPHDFLIQNIGIKNLSFKRNVEIKMLYRQHENNTFGHQTSVMAFPNKLFTLFKIMERKKKFFECIVILYGGNISKIYSNRMHQNWVLDQIFKIFVRYVW